MGFDSAPPIDESSDIDHQQTSNRTHSGDDITPTSVSTDKINNVQKPFNLLRNAGYADTDALPALSFGGEDVTRTTSSDTYTDIFVGRFQVLIVLERHFPNGACNALVQFNDCVPNGDQIDVRLQDDNQGVTIAEVTGVTTTTQITLGPTTYTPTNPGSQSFFKIQARNSDNTTSVELRDPVAYLRVPPS